MQFVKLDPAHREALMASLAAMPALVRGAFGGLNVEQSRAPGPGASFSPVEQVWHLADLEREGFAVRIERLLAERDPHLAHFDGSRVAAARDYRSRPLHDGLAAFEDARARNLAALRALDAASWLLSGTQEGVGVVSLCDIPGFMAQHDEAHRLEIDAWLRQRPSTT